MSEPACKDCRFWARDSYGRALAGNHCDGSASECRRHAPREVSQPSPSGDARWPLTRKDEWCGEFQPKAMATEPAHSAGPGEEAVYASLSGPEYERWLSFLQQRAGGPAKKGGQP